MDQRLQKIKIGLQKHDDAMKKGFEKLKFDDHKDDFREIHEKLHKNHVETMNSMDRLIASIALFQKFLK